jgi:uncharacterized protein involved in outer membrane biogenesis
MARTGMTRKLLIVISTVLVLVIAAAATAAWLLRDSHYLKTALEDLASAATERTLRINGDFSVSLGRIVSIHATDIEWLNPAWSSKPYMLKLRELNVSVDLWSLIEQPVLITSVQASDAELLFEWTDKQFNWVTGSTDSNAGSPGNPLPLLLDHAELDNIHLHFIHPGLTDELVIELQQVRQQQDESGHLVLDIASVFDGRAFKIAGRVGTFRQLTVAGNIDYDLAISGQHAMLTASGAFADLARLEGPKLDFRFTAPETAVLLDILNLPDITHGPADLAANVQSDGERLAVTASGTVGEFELQASGKVDRPASLEGLAFDVTSSGPDARTLARLAGIEGFPDRSYTLRAKVNTATQGLVIEDFEYSMQGLQLGASGAIGKFPELREFDVQLSLAGNNLADFKGLAANLQLPELPFSIKGTLRDMSESSGIEISDLEIRLPEARLGGKLSSDWPGRPGDIKFALDASGKNLKAALPVIPGYKPQNVAFNAQANGEYSSDKISIGAGKARIGTADINFSGLLRLAPEFGAQAIHIQASGSSLADLGTVGERALPALPFQLSADVGGTAILIKAEILSLKVGNSNLRGKFDFNGTNRPFITADLRSSFIDLNDFIQAPDAAEKVASGKPSKDDRLLSSEPLPLAWLNDYDGNVRLEVTEIITQNRNLHDLVVDASLSDGELLAKQIDIGTTDGSLTARLYVRPLPDKTEVSAELSATDVIIALRKMSKADHEKLPRHKIDATLTARGNSIAELGASMNGFVWVRSRGGQMPSTQLGAIMGDFPSEVLGKINPFVKKRDHIMVDCTGVYLEVESGILSTAPTVVFLGDQILITGSGNIDLATEKIDFELETTPAKGLGISASELVDPFTRIGGTLSEPLMVLDAESAAIQGGAAVATGGLSLLAKGLWKRWVGSHDICEKVEEEARKIRQKRDPDNVPG